MIAWLEPGAPFPPLSEALPQDSKALGLLAASRSLDPQRLLDAYRQGIFPWYSQGEPLLWCNTDPRMVLRPEDFKVSDSLRKVLRDPDWQIRVNVGFTEVMLACAGVPRPVQAGTWITTELIGAYSALYAMHQAHSIETWVRGERVGGLYGVTIGRMFFGESMFVRATDSSKIALAALCAFLRRQGVPMIDCQQKTAHLASLGARPIDYGAFVEHVRGATGEAPLADWNFDKTVLADWLDDQAGR
ncbi:MAG: leucyl/phenylalanyl-tRNA--protein transferase [Candidatus Protistobacter heckmanni]|nr:leucyl/phenylalanyl-tRNA--protein transferase [Candidatus Protistobacter heckmanni]